MKIPKEKPDWTIAQTWRWFREGVLDSFEDSPQLVEFSYNSYMCGAKAMFEMMRTAPAHDDPTQFIINLAAELEAYAKKSKEKTSVTPPVSGPRPS